MKFKSTIVGSAVMAAIFAAVSSASAAESIQINLQYIGSTTGVTTNTATKIAQNGSTGSGGMIVNTTNFPGGSVANAQAGLQQLDLTDPATASIVGLKNYFAAYVQFTPGDVANDFIYGFGITINYPSYMTPVSGNNVADLSTNKFIPFNPVDANTGVLTWDTGPGDFGINTGDLVGIGAFQATLGSANAMLIGEAGAVGNGDDAGYIAGKGTLFGLFALAFTSTPQTHDLVTAQGIPATYAAWNSGVQLSSDALITAGAPVPVGPVPEPASLGVLALGGLALLARRRKVA